MNQALENLKQFLLYYLFVKCTLRSLLLKDLHILLMLFIENVNQGVFHIKCYSRIKEVFEDYVESSLDLFLIHLLTILRYEGKD